MSYFRNNRMPEYAAYGGVQSDEAYGRANGGVPYEEAYGKKKDVNNERENRPTLREQLEANWQKIKGQKEENAADDDAIGTQYAENGYTITATDADYSKQPNYSLYGDGFSKEFIDQMLNDERFQRAMNTRTRANEGGYVNNPNDMGGATNYGISSRWYPNEDIINMTPERASAILYRDYWLQPKMYLLPDEFSDIVFDDGVLQGQPTAIKSLQNALGIKADGIIGPNTINAFDNKDNNVVKSNFIKNVHNIEDKYLQNNPNQRVFEKGHRDRFNRY